MCGKALPSQPPKNLDPDLHPFCPVPYDDMPRDAILNVESTDMLPV